ncbi:MAG: hypothetical protein WAW37_12885 [Syntrophobacteraceae bacterium]
MRKRLTWSVVLVWLIVAFASSGPAATDELSAKAVSAGISPTTIDAFKAALAEGGFNIREWGYGEVDVAQLVCSRKLPSGYGNNAGGNYLAITFDIDGVIAPRQFQLRPTDAVVLIGRTPPPVAYFSYRTYLFKHNYEGQPEPQVIFASLGDTLNNLVIKPGGSSGDPYNKNVVVISTADQGTDARVRSAAMSVGISPNIMNTDVIPSSVVKLGLGPESDKFILLNRLTLPAYGHEQDLIEYMQNPGMTVLHLTPKQSGAAPPDPFPTPVLRVRGTGMTEADLMPSVEKLRQAILAAYPGYQATEFTTQVWINEWLDGIQREVNILGETRDTSYLCTSTNFTLANNVDEFLVVYGVNHQATGKATYSSFSVYQQPKELGISGLNSPGFAGSAADYIPQDSNVPFLYAWKAARNCGDDAKCLKIALPEGLPPCPVVNLNKDLFVGFRAYLEPETAVGPATSEILYDRVIKFTKISN